MTSSDESMVDLGALHKHCFRNREEVLASVSCGCFNCLRTYEPSQIRDLNNSEGTAFCPFCGVDAVLGSAIGIPITPELLLKMNVRWFSPPNGPRPEVKVI